MQYEKLFDIINAIIPASEKLKQRLKDNIKEESYPKHYLLLEKGQIDRKIYFIKKGFARAYYFEGGKEITVWFRGAGDFMISVLSFFRQSPAIECIELLENTTLLSLTWNQLQAIYEEFPEFERVGRILVERYYMLGEERAMLLRTTSAAERYKRMIEQYPQIMQKAKLGKIASYLSITQETLSRIRRLKNL